MDHADGRLVVGSRRLAEVSARLRFTTKTVRIQDTLGTKSERNSRFLFFVRAWCAKCSSMFTPSPPSNGENLPIQTSSSGEHQYSSKSPHAGTSEKHTQCALCVQVLRVPHSVCPSLYKLSVKPQPTPPKRDSIPSYRKLHQLIVAQVDLRQAWRSEDGVFSSPRSPPEATVFRRNSDGDGRGGLADGQFVPHNHLQTT